MKAAVPARVWNATALQVAGRVWGSLCTFAILALLARHLGAAEFGRYTFWLAVFGLLDGLTDFGTGAVAVQRTAADSWAVPGVLRVMRRVRFGMASLGIVAVALGVALGGEEGAFWIVLATGYELTHVFELSATVFKNRIAWGIPVAARAFAATVRLGLVLLLWNTGTTSAAVFLFGTALGSSLANVALHLAARRHLPRPTVPVAAPRGLLAAAVPLGLAGVCQQLYFYVDNAFVRASLGDDALGHYNSGVRLLSFGILGAQVATGAALPWLTRSYREHELGPAVARLAGPLFLAASLAAGFAAPFAEPLLALVYGPSFEVAGPSLRWLLGALAAIYAGAPLLTAVVAAGRTRAVLAVTAVGLLLNTLGNAWAVPRYGIEGAAAATLVTEVSVVVGAAIALRDVRPWRERPLGWWLPPVAFGLAWFAGSALSGALS